MVLCCVVFAGVRSPLSVGKQLRRSSELPILLSVSIVADRAHVQHICTVYGLRLGPQASAAHSAKHCVVSFQFQITSSK